MLALSIISYIHSLDLLQFCFDIFGCSAKSIHNLLNLHSLIKDLHFYLCSFNIKLWCIR